MQIKQIIIIHTRDPKSTKQSIGVLYGLAISYRPLLQKEDWKEIHDVIYERFNLPIGDPKRMAAMEVIKKAGWRFYDRMCDAHRAASQNGG